VRGSPSVPLLAVVLVLLTVIILVALRTTLHLAILARLANRERVPSDGRSPPSF
jgi:biopolymer transport protein ExbD